eukprot:1666386-Prymnesium_polylepis.1
MFVAASGSMMKTEACVRLSVSWRQSAFVGAVCCCARQSWRNRASRVPSPSSKPKSRELCVLNGLWRRGARKHWVVSRSQQRKRVADNWSRYRHPQRPNLRSHTVKRTHVYRLPVRFAVLTQ